MGIDMKNSEGYMDLVPYQALTNIERKDKAVSKPAFRPLVYICAPFNGAVKENVLKATQFAGFAFNCGCIPLTPHLLFPFMDDSNEKERDLAIFMDIILMGKCQEVWVLGDVISRGMSIEIEKARKRRQLVRYFNRNFEEVDAL
ncbi:DUF4406 domain-containing protein [Mobilitalea sibirica]|uniref:DUF4406 domain-containing protein n=1 Tax=Mobilitalea sibirica TaxID=1462919 RepID=A0A8J7H0V7_9FIRM|nr:DUF4406 domain-containing protein [Mobilitalea sibirica]MBH1939853.1 DUF4406 domain-containing protein [Mobilitalea sibirica]